MSVKIRVVALHGFLGHAADWQPVFDEIRALRPNWELLAPDWMEFLQTEQPLTFAGWANRFLGWCRTLPAAKNTIVGYSLGGRLALHAVDRQPELWSAGVFLSTNPGLVDPKEKLARWQSDQDWAREFRQEDFATVLAKWNSQPVLQGGSEPDRNFNRNHVALLSQCLNSFSLGLQNDFRDRMDLWHLRQIWAAGTRDRKFSELLKTLPELPEIQKWEVDEASHRLIFDAPQEVAHFIMRASMPPVPLEA